MSEAEYNRLLEAVSGAVAPRGDLGEEIEFRNEPPRAANDNGLLWPLLPFPRGWTASC